MLEDEFKTLLHRIALALGIAQSHPDPAAYADEVINAHDSINAKVKVPDPVAAIDTAIDAAVPVEVKEDAGNVPAVVASSVVDAAITSTGTATTSSEQPAHADGESPAIQGE